MSINMQTFNDRKEWLEARKSFIGGSDASAVIGENPYMSNVDLWQIKTGRFNKPFVTNSAIEYGNNAEALLRELFALDNPSFAVSYKPYNIWLNSDYPLRTRASMVGTICQTGGSASLK